MCLPQGVSDGAAAVVVASEDALKEHKLTPLARIVSYHISGCDPTVMGIGNISTNPHTLEITERFFSFLKHHFMSLCSRSSTCYNRSSEESRAHIE